MIGYFVLHFLVLGLLIYGWLMVEQDRLLRPFLLPALLLRLVCGVLVGWLYRYYFNGGDTFAYHTGSLLLSAWGHQETGDYLQLLFFDQPTPGLPLLPRNFAMESNSFFLIKVLSVLNFVTGGNYYLNGLYLSLFSFSGCWRLVKALAFVYPSSRLAAVFAFLFFPSVVFWSSGLMKESILMGSLGWLVSGVLFMSHRSPRRAWFEVPVVLLAGYLLWRIKFFVAVILFPVLGGYGVGQLLARQVKQFEKGKVKALLFGIMLVLIGLLALQSHIFFRAGQSFFLEHVVFNYESILGRTSPERPAIRFDELEPTPQSLLQNAPEALGSAIYRPFFWETTDPAYVLISVENLLLLVLTVLALIGLFERKYLRLDLFLLGLLLYVVVLGVMMGLTTPNFGTLSRYRIAFLPFLVFLLLQSGILFRILARAVGFSVRKP
jgi:hypothetical protein